MMPSTHPASEEFNMNNDSQHALEDEAIDRWVQLHSGNAGEAEKQAFEHWRQQSPAHEAAAREAEQLWQDIGQTHTAHLQQAEPLKTKVTPLLRARRWLALPIAACLCAIVITLQYLPMAGIYADYTTQVGEQRQIDLPDGSRIYLNSATALSVDYQANERRIELHSGEALFNVTKNPTRPFIVSANGSESRVLGTTFNVRTGKDTTVTVTEGRVRLQDARYPNQQRTLNANQQARFSAGQLSDIDRIEAAQQTAWHRGRLIFTHTPLSEVVAELARYQPGTILIMDEKLSHQRISGVFDLKQPDKLLTTLQHSLSVELIELPWLTLIHPREK